MGIHEKNHELSYRIIDAALSVTLEILRNA
jgi:hypothetical protein